MESSWNYGGVSEKERKEKKWQCWLRIMLHLILIAGDGTGLPQLLGTGWTHMLHAYSPQ